MESKSPGGLLVVRYLERTFAMRGSAEVSASLEKHAISNQWSTKKGKEREGAAKC
jgi:hypothetical protein